mmetsp:Transcript_32978/g.77357  ORF Transcript_32978/g.77357 Transcript_32978/m.77357 type:complete len:229 (-) Transcript_32978:692-1378(-)
MRHRHQVGLGRQRVGLVAPVAVRERPVLTGVEELLEPVLDVAEVAGAGHRMRRRHQVLQVARLLGIGLQRVDNVDPVQRVQVVEVHRVVVHLQRLGHHLADQVRVLRDLDAQRVLDRPHAGQRVAAGAHAADPLDEGPGVARVAALEDDLQPAPHGARGNGVADHVVLVEVDLAAHVTFDARHRVDDDAPSAVVELEALGFVCSHVVVSQVFCLSRLRRRPSRPRPCC